MSLCLWWGKACRQKACQSVHVESENYFGVNLVLQPCLKTASVIVPCFVHLASEHQALKNLLSPLTGFWGQTISDFLLCVLGSEFRSSGFLGNHCTH